MTHGQPPTKARQTVILDWLDEVEELFTRRNRSSLSSVATIAASQAESLGLPLGLEAPVMTPNGVIFLFFSEPHII